MHGYGRRITLEDAEEILTQFAQMCIGMDGKLYEIHTITGRDEYECITPIARIILAFNDKSIPGMFEDVARRLKLRPGKDYDIIDAVVLNTEDRTIPA